MKLKHVKEDLQKLKLLFAKTTLRKTIALTVINASLLMELIS